MFLCSVQDEYNKILQLEISKKEKPRKQSKDAMFQLPAIIKEIPHRESVLRILPTAGNSFMLMGQDGLISFWSSALKFKKSRSLFVSSTMETLDLFSRAERCYGGDGRLRELLWLRMGKGAFVIEAMWENIFYYMECTFSFVTFSLC